MTDRYIYIRIARAGVAQYAFRRQDGTWSASMKPEFARVFSGVKFSDARDVSRAFPPGEGKRDWHFVAIGDITMLPDSFDFSVAEDLRLAVH